MKYCIIYAQPNIFSGERISVGLVCLTETGCVYKYSEHRVKVSKYLLPEAMGEYLHSFLKVFRSKYIDGRSNAGILSSLDTLYRYSNNYIVFSEVRELELPENLMSPERLYSELIEH